MSTRMRMAVALAMAGAMAGMAYVPPANAISAPQGVIQPVRNVPRHVYGGAIAAGFRKNGPGWTAAQVKRMATKRRNRARHKAACRAKG